MKLPTSPIEAEIKSPKRFTFYTSPKTGKTTLLSMLPGCLILDFENGSDYVTALKIKVIGIEPPEKEKPEDKNKRHENQQYYLIEILLQIKADGDPYQFIAVDTTSGLEDMCLPLAAKLYKATPMGKDFPLDGDVKSLPQGAGYLYLRNAFKSVLDMIQRRTKYLILSGHLMEKIDIVGDKEVSTKDIDLTGKIRTNTFKDSDAIAYGYRLGNKVIFNFNTSEKVIAGGRSAHLRNKKITMLEQLEDGTFKSHWDEIYIDIPEVKGH